VLASALRKIAFAAVVLEVAMETPNNLWSVGWYRGGPSPGAPGDAVIDGHVGLPGSPLVFYLHG
jgi:hypothetical protein